MATRTRFNPPPNWPAPPPGWTPPEGWRPDVSWGPPPAGWQLWVDVPEGHRTAARAQRGWVRRHKGLSAAMGAAAVVLVAGVAGAGAQQAAPVSATGALPSGTTSPPAPASAPASTTSTPATSGADAAAGATTTVSSAAASRPGSALSALATLPVKGRAPMTGYRRDQFGQAWADVDRNGCDTRNDVLRRDLVHLVLKSGTRGCVVLSGDLAPEPYSGQAQHFVRGVGTSTQVQIDHVVALGDAWQKGAQQWSAARRLAFANDPLELLSVNGPLNQQKGDGDAATWLPPNRSYRCAYVARQVAVKAKYGLWVTAAERDAMERVLARCPGQGLPTSTQPAGAALTAAAPTRTNATTASTTATTPPAVPRTSAPAPTSSTAGGGLDPRFSSCKAAKAAGYGPYYEGKDPEYAWYRDGDGDGVDCE